MNVWIKAFGCAITPFKHESPSYSKSQSDPPAVHRTAVASIHRATSARPAPSSAPSRRSGEIRRPAPPASGAPPSVARRLPGRMPKRRRGSSRWRKSRTRHRSPVQTKTWKTLWSSRPSRLRPKSGTWRTETIRHFKIQGLNQFWHWAMPVHLFPLNLSVSFWSIFFQFLRGRSSPLLSVQSALVESLQQSESAAPWGRNTRSAYTLSYPLFISVSHTHTQTYESLGSQGHSICIHTYSG